MGRRRCGPRWTSLSCNFVRSVPGRRLPREAPFRRSSPAAMRTGVHASSHSRHPDGASHSDVTVRPLLRVCATEQHALGGAKVRGPRLRAHLLFLTSPANAGPSNAASCTRPGPRAKPERGGQDAQTAGSPHQKTPHLPRPLGNERAWMFSNELGQNGGVRRYHAAKSGQNTAALRGLSGSKSRRDRRVTRPSKGPARNESCDNDARRGESLFIPCRLALLEPRPADAGPATGYSEGGSTTRRASVLCFGNESRDRGTGQEAAGLRYSLQGGGTPASRVTDWGRLFDSDDESERRHS